MADTIHNQEQADNQVQVIGKTFAILEFLSTASQPKGPTEIAQATGMSKSTVHRLLGSLYTLGYVEKGTDRKYRIGIKLVEIVSNHINNLELQTEARPVINELHADLQLIVHLGILDGPEVVYVEKIDILPNLRLYAQIGRRVPAFCSSLGKCLLAPLSGDALERIFWQYELEQYTTHTITNLKDLRQHLRQVRQQGWAMDNEEYILGHRCIAAPVYDYRGEVIAAVSASGPTSLITTERIEKVAKRVKQAADEIARKLMYSA
jgi:DNA-binding IclR family transcriptional regulator